MSERKTLKVRAETFNQLDDEKGDFETWDGLLNRLLREATDD